MLPRMATATTIADQQVQSRVRGALLGIGLLAAGFFLRLRLAWLTFLNPDEALHYFLSHQPSLKLAYHASLTTAHPPLMILFLHYWSRLGSSEFFLRLPFVLAGTLFCWIMFLWSRKVAGCEAGWFALALFLFAPSLISLSAEIRQYSFLLFFCACALYSLERALAQNSSVWITVSAVGMYLALLTHYSALIFAATLAIYGLSRLNRPGRPIRFAIAWSATQAGALAICAFLYRSQISQLRRNNVPTELAATWLRSSIFHRGENNVVSFAWTRSLRLFRYFFSHGTIGVIAFFLFAFAIGILLRQRKLVEKRIALAVLLALPFVIAMVAAFVGIYPYGGTRHDVLLAMFAIPGIAIGLDRLPRPPFTWLKPALVAAGLIICNFFPSPSGPYIRARNQRRDLMRHAMSYLRTLPANSTILTDQQGSMVLNYYLCGEQMPLPFSTQREALLKLQCGDYDLLVAGNTQTGFDRNVFPAVPGNAWQFAPEEQTLYLFQSGWIDDKEQEWLEELRSLGGKPRNFGPNILICPITKTNMRDDGG